MFLINLWFDSPAKWGFPSITEDLFSEFRASYSKWFGSQPLVTFVILLAIFPYWWTPNFKIVTYEVIYEVSKYNVVFRFDRRANLPFFVLA